jgi:hypothetical protein
VADKAGNGIDPMSAAPLTEDNLRKLGGPSRQEQEESLLAKAQAISQLLAQVDGALDDVATTRPPTGASSQRLLTADSYRGVPTAEGRKGTCVASSRTHVNDERLGTGTSCESSRNPTNLVSHACPPSKHDPQVVTLADLTEPEIKLVQYTGQQSHMAGGKGRRKVESRATKSEIGSMLSWG